MQAINNGGNSGGSNGYSMIPHAITSSSGIIKTQGSTSGNHLSIRTPSMGHSAKVSSTSV